jgi:hypothetical protein
MAAASANIPTLITVTGPMMTGDYKGERLGACTDCRRLWGLHRAGEIDEAEIDEIGGRLMPTAGTCMVMGTASTMACMTEALGMMLPGGAVIPAVHADRLRHAEASGARAVAMAAEGLTPDRIMTPEAFANSLRVLLAIGGSTNGLIHMTAVAGRLGIAVDLEALDAMGRETPVLVDLKPSGAGYMEDLHKAGGLTTVLREMRDLLHLDAPTCTGGTLGENMDAMPADWNQKVVRRRADPVHAEGGIAVLRGNLCPGGAIIKQSGADAGLMTHTGRAVAFDSLEDMANRIDDPDLDVAADDVLVLRNSGPKGAPGMPEAGYIPIPKKLAQQGGFGGPPCLPRSRHRRPAGVRARWRQDYPGRAEPAAGRGCVGRRTGGPPRRVDSAGSGVGRARLPAPAYAACATGRRGVRSGFHGEAAVYGENANLAGYRIEPATQRPKGSQTRARTVLSATARLALSGCTCCTEAWTAVIAAIGTSDWITST